MELPDASPASRSSSVRREQAPEVEAFLRQSKKRWQTAEAATAKLREEWRLDQQFAAGKNHWTQDEVTARSDEGRPCLTIARIPQFIRQVENQQRASRSQIQIAPRGNGATKDTAAVLQGMVRSIEVDSDSDVAYDTACHHQLRIGIGFVRLRAKWAEGATWEQVIQIARLRNPLSVYWDPSTQEADFSDMRFAHIIAGIGKDEYESRWGDVSSYDSLVEYQRTTRDDADWMPEGKVIVAEYFYTTAEDRVLYQLATGEPIWQTEYAKFQQAWLQKYPAHPVPPPHRERTVKKRVVRWALHNAVDILEGNRDRTEGREIPGTRIPLYPVVGDEIDLDGTVEYRGMVRDGRDPQRMYNFWASSIAEAVTLAPKAPWIAAAGQIQEYIDDWKEANRKAHSVLQYDPKTVDGNLVPPPQRTVAEPAIQAMVQGLNQSNSDLQAVMGLYDPSLGYARPEQSGKAIEAQQAQGQVANSNYLDNVTRTKRAVGRSLLEWIPVIYDTARIIHLVMPDGTKQQAAVHVGEDNAPDDSMLDQAPDVTGVYDLGVGSYEVTVSTGPSFKTEREQTEGWLLELFKVLPGLAAVGADILLENADIPVAKQLAKRAKAMLPPQVQAEEGGGDPAAELQQAKSQLAQATQQIQELSQLVDGHKIKADALITSAKMHADQAVFVKAMDNASKIAVARITAAKEAFDSGRESIEERIALGLEHGHEAAQADLDRQHEKDLQAADHQHTLEQTATAAALEPPAPDTGATDA